MAHPVCTPPGVPLRGANFQFALAQSITDLDPSIGIRLSVPKRATRSTYVDRIRRAERQVSLIEFKYMTLRGPAPIAPPTRSSASAVTRHSTRHACTSFTT